MHPAAGRHTLPKLLLLPPACLGGVGGPAGRTRSRIRLNVRPSEVRNKHPHGSGLAKAQGCALAHTGASRERPLLSRPLVLLQLLGLHGTTKNAAVNLPGNGSSSGLRQLYGCTDASQPRHCCACQTATTPTLPLTTPLPWGSLVSLPPLKVNSPAQLVLGLLPGLRVLQVVRWRCKLVSARWQVGSTAGWDRQ